MDSGGDVPASPSLEELFDVLFERSEAERADYYANSGVSEALATTVEELFTAHAAADFDLPEAPCLADLTPSPPFSGEGEVLDQRYELVGQLGDGSFGTVYRAVDRLTEEQVAVKVARGAAHSHAALEREAACLRRLEHGVARLRDQGAFAQEEGGEFHYLVYDLIEGAPFPGGGCPRRAFHSLLGGVAAVHARGVVHRDLKPANVLVTEQQEVFLVDFGIAHGPAFGAELVGRDRSVGTEAFAAPEQLAGEMGDAASDVFSCALMGLKALTGASALELRSPALPRAIDPANAGLVSALFTVVQAPREDRPTNAHELELWLDGLDEADGSAGGVAVQGVSLGATRTRLRRLVEKALQESGAPGTALLSVFAGIEPIHHLRSGAAQELDRRCGRDETAAVRLLQEWIQRGLAFWSGDRIELHSSGLQALRREPLAVRLLEDGASEASSHETSDTGSGRLEVPLEDSSAKRAWTERVAVEARRLEDDGWSAQASALLAASLARVRIWPLGSAAAEQRLLPELVRLALHDGTLPVLDRAAFEVARSRCHGPIRKGLDLALQVARSSALGDHSRVTQSTVDLVQPLGGSQLGLCEARRDGWDCLMAVVLSVLYFASQSLEPRLRRQLCRELVRRAREYGAGLERPDGAAQSALRSYRLRWAALAAYRRGQYARSAALYRASARAGDSVSGSASSLLSAASAWMEASSFDAALADVAEAQERIAGLPFPTLEARAFWTLRTIRFRMGECPEPDLELDAGFEALGSLGLSALHCLTEAGIARAGENAERWRAMAKASFKSFEALGRPDSIALARALMIDAGDEAEPEDAALFGALTPESDPGVALQVLALAPEAREVCSHLLPGWKKEFEPGPPGRRLDVLGVSEIETRLGLVSAGKLA